MKRPPRFLFDECIAEPIMEQIREQVYSEIVFEHVVTKFRSGIQDEDWIPKLKDDNFEYVVITSDGGKNSIRGKKLPELCRENKVTHVILSAKLSQLTSSKNKRLLSVNGST